MAYTSAAGLTHHRWRSRLPAFFAECGAFFTLLGAAIRVAHAIEGRRQPSSTDLSLLGMKGPVPTAR